MEVNEMGSTIQQGVIQHPVCEGMQSRTTANMITVQSSMMPQTGSLSNQGHSNGNGASDPEGNGRDRLPEHNSTNYVVNYIHENRPLSLNDIGRPVFVNHYYAEEPLIPVTSIKFIILDECNVSTDISARSPRQIYNPRALTVNL